MFPNYKIITKKHSFLFWKWTTKKKIEDGWKDLIVIPKEWTDITGGSVIASIKCSKCHSRIRIGKENDKTFQYCPLCMEKEPETHQENKAIADP